MSTGGTNFYAYIRLFFEIHKKVNQGFPKLNISRIELVELI